MTVVGSSTVIANGTDTALIRVVARDQYNNPMAGATVAWGQIPLNNAQTVNTDANGVGDFTVSSTTVGDQLIEVYINNVKIKATATITFVAGPPARLRFVVQPSASQAGIPISPAVQVSIEDLNGHVCTTSTLPVTVALGQGGGGGSLLGTLTVNATAGVARFADLSIDLAGAGYTLAATAPQLAAETSAAFDITSTGGGGGGGASTNMVILVDPSNTLAGQVIAPAVQVQLLKANGSVDVNSTASVTVTLSTNPSGATLGGTTTVAAVAGVATFSDLAITKSATGYRLRASAAGLSPVTSAAFDVSPAAPAALKYAVQPSTVQAGSNITPAIQVAVVDAFDNICTGDTSTVSVALATNPGGATLAGTLSTNAVAGIAVFGQVNLDKTGTGYSLKASRAGVPDAVSGNFDVTPGAPSHLKFTVQPVQATAGQTMTAVQVSLLDPLGNVRTTANDHVQIAIGPNPPAAGTLSGTLDVAAVNGVATFGALTIDKSGQGYTLAATATGYGGDTSAAFDVVAGAPSVLAITASPQSGVAGQTLSTVEVTLRDAQGNTINSTSTVTLVVDQGPGLLKGATQRPAVAGVATFDAVYLEKAGSYTLSATASGYAGAPPTSAFTVVHGPAAKLGFTTQPTASVIARQTLGNVAVTVYDAFDNLIDDAVVTITMGLGTDPSGGAALLRGTTSQDSAAGVATFPDLSLNKAFQGYTLKASATLSGNPVQVASSAFDVTAGTAAGLRFVTQPPASVVTGTVMLPSVQVAIEDLDGNRCTTSTASVSLTLTGQDANFPGTLGGTTTQSAVTGVATFDNLTVDYVKTGYGLDAASAGLAGASSSAFAVVFGPGPMTWYVSNTALAGGNGQQTAPFNKLSSAEAAARSGDTILVLQGDGTTNNQNGITLPDGVTLQGQGAALIGPVVLGSACTVKDISVTAPGGTAISGTNKNGATIANVTLSTCTAAVVLNGVTGTIYISQLTATQGVGRGLIVADSGDALVDLSTLSIDASSGPALQVNNTAPGTGRLSCTGVNTLSANGAAVVDLLRVVVPADLAFDQLSSTNSTDFGIRLELLGGTGGVAVSTGVTISSPAQSGILVKNCGSLRRFDFGATTVTSAGSPTVTGCGLDGATGNNNSTFVFSKLDVTTNKGAAVLLGGSTLTVSDGTISANLAPALDLSGTTIGSPCTFASVSSTNSATVGVRLDTLGGAGTLWMKGGSLAATGADISVTGGTASVTFDGNITNVAGPSVSVTGRLAGAGLVKITGQVSDVSGPQDRGIVYSSNAGGTLVFTNTVTITMTSGTPVQMANNTGGKLQFVAAVALTTTTGTTVSSSSSSATLDIAAGGTITSSTGTAFAVSGASAPTVTCNATVKSVGGRVASIQNLTGGSVTLSGNLDGDDVNGLGLLVNACSGGTVTFSGASKQFACGSSAGITLTSNTGATVRFTNGGLTVACTSGSAFVATGGGTVEVRGVGNMLTTTTGSAVNVANTTIGANGLSFASINTNGAPTAILLNTTGALGGLTVSGDGTTTRNGSGGTLQNGGTALDVTSASTVTLHGVNMSNTTGPGIRGSNVTNLRLEYVGMSGCGDNNGGSAPYDQGISITNLRGTNNAFVGCSFTASSTAERLVQIVNSTGTGAADTLSVDTCTFTGTSASAVGADLLEVTSQGSSGSAGNLTASILNCTFSNAATNGFQQIVQTFGKAAFTIATTNFSGTPSCVDMQAIDNATLTFDIHGCAQMYASGGPGTNIVSLFTGNSASATGKIDNNNDMRGGGAAASGNGVRLDVNDTSTAVVEVKSNTISNIGLDYGIDARARSQSAWLQATITGNVVSVLATALYDMRVEAGSGVGVFPADNAKVTANIASNTCSAAGTALKACYMRTRDTGNVIQLQGFTTDATTTWTSNGNTPAGSITVVNNGTIQAGTPSTPP